MEFQQTVTLAITGASGAQYGIRLLYCLVKANCKVQLLLSSAAEIVIKTETQFEIPETLEEKNSYLREMVGASETQLQVYSKDDWFCPAASGSGEASAMVICPASGGTLSAVANGASNNLIERAADVALKERWKLIFVPREAPYSEVHLENMLRLTRMGAIIIPASPGFYQQPKTIDDLVDFVVARILDKLDLDQALVARWGSEN